MTRQRVGKITPNMRGRGGLKPSQTEDDLRVAYPSVTVQEAEVSPKITGATPRVERDGNHETNLSLYSQYHSPTGQEKNMDNMNDICVKCGFDGIPVGLCDHNLCHICECATCDFTKPKPL
jgi:hypothetical protein